MEDNLARALCRRSFYLSQYLHVVYIVGEVPVLVETGEGREIFNDVG